LLNKIVKVCLFENVDFTCYVLIFSISLFLTTYNKLL